MDLSGGTPGPHSSPARNSSKASSASELVPYVAHIEPPPASRRRTLRARAVNLAAWIIAVAGPLGLAFAAGLQVRSSGMPAKTQSVPVAPLAAIAPQNPAAGSEALKEAAETLRALRVDVDNLRRSAAADRAALEPSRLKERLDELSTRLGAARTETTRVVAELSSKIESLRDKVSPKLDNAIERLDRIERQASVVPTSAAPSPRPAAVPLPSPASAKAPPQADVADVVKRPPVIRSWVVRDVYDGLALVEGVAGAIEVGPGEVVPGAGRVKSIERRGMGWIVVTNRGVIDQAHGPFER